MLASLALGAHDVKGFGALFQKEMLRRKQKGPLGKSSPLAET
jgi:hypothetical protein